MKKTPRERPLSEITLRKYEQPEGLTGRELLKKVCLSLGLLNPGDTRDAIIDILHVLITKKTLRPGELEAELHHAREEQEISMKGITPPNIRRQLKRLKDIQLIEKYEGAYRIIGGLTLHEAYLQHVKKNHLENISQRVEHYLKEADETTNK